ncbi:MAG: hypothetical protein K8953_05230 [Proteobacteria bacterium]|nr:hypothetical protein [Pseudomonadota bacterium]
MKILTKQIIIATIAGVATVLLVRAFTNGQDNRLSAAEPLEEPFYT